jgi:type III secretion system needle length determinant
MTSAIKTDAKIPAAPAEVRNEFVVGSQKISQKESTGGQEGLFSEILQDITVAIDASDEGQGKMEQTSQPLIGLANDTKKDTVATDDTSSQLEDSLGVQMNGLAAPNVHALGNAKETIPVSDQSLNVATKQQMIVDLTEGNAFQSINPALVRQRTKEASMPDFVPTGNETIVVDKSKALTLQDDASAAISIAANAGGTTTLLQAEAKNAQSGRNEGAVFSSPLPPVVLNISGEKPTSASGTPLKLPSGSPTEWRQSLIEALGDRIQIGVGQRSEQATIRLDPPMLGSVEIVIRHQAGSLQVQLSASNGEVVRQLQQMSDGLRQELTQKQFTGVSVQVANHQPDRDGQGRQQYFAQNEDEPFRAWNEDASNTPKFALNT